MCRAENTHTLFQKNRAQQGIFLLSLGPYQTSTIDKETKIEIVKPDDKDDMQITILMEKIAFMILE